MIRFQIDSVKDIQLEVEDVLEGAWRETVDHKELLSYDDNDVDWEFYVDTEDAGTLHVLTARDSGKLIGYNFLMIMEHPHYKVLHAVSDMIWVKDSYRGQGLGKKLISFSENYLEHIGGGLMVYNFKVGKPHPNMDSMDYKHTENVFTKVIG